jgi:PAS domain S-box-containing protein
MTAPDQGGEAPCFAHLLDEPAEHTDEALAELLRQLADAVVIADADGTITFWNQAATRLFGWPAHEAVGRSLDLIIPERLRARHWAGYRQTMATGHTSYGDRLLEVPALHRDGRALSIAFTVTLMHEPDGGTPTAIAAVLRDDTERWQERRRLRAELTALRGGGTTTPATPSASTP